MGPHPLPYSILGQAGSGVQASAGPKVPPQELVDRSAQSSRQGAERVKGKERLRLGVGRARLEQGDCKMSQLMRAVLYTTMILAVAVLASGGLSGGLAGADPKPPPGMSAELHSPAPSHVSAGVSCWPGGVSCWRPLWWLPPWWPPPWWPPPWWPPPWWPPYPGPPWRVVTAHADPAVVTTDASVPIGCEVKDGQGMPVDGVVCLFKVASQPGTDASVSEQSAVTDASGRATSTLKTGSAAGSVTVTAEAQGVSSQVQVSVHQSPGAQHEIAMSTIRALFESMRQLLWH